MRSGKMLQVIFSAARLRAVIVTTTEERAEKILKYADEVLKGTGLESPDVIVDKYVPRPNDGLKIQFCVLDEFWKQEE
jgi:hypothetical protein